MTSTRATRAPQAPCRCKSRPSAQGLSVQSGADNTETPRAHSARTSALRSPAAAPSLCPRHALLNLESTSLHHESARVSAQSCPTLDWDSPGPMEGLGGTHPQNCGALLAPHPAGGGRSCQSGSRRTGARSPQGQRVAACGLSGGGSVCLCVCMSVSVCVCVVCTGLLYVPACVPVCTHPLAYTGPCACVCRVLRSGTCEPEIAEEANMLLAGGRTVPWNLTWGPRASSDGGG